MVHWEDLKADIKDVFGEFKRHKIGWIGVALIGFMIVMGLLAPVMGPGVPEDWRRGARRWDRYPAHAPPVWVDWITRDDHARQSAIEDWDLSTSRRSPVTSEREFETSVLFDEIGNTTLELWHEEGERQLAEHVVEVKEREMPGNLTILDFTVEEVEDNALEFAPANVEIFADIANEGEQSENITLTMPQGEPLSRYDEERGEWIVATEHEFEVPAEADEESPFEIRFTKEEDPVDESHTFRFDGAYSIFLGSEFEIVEVGTGEDVIIDDLTVTDGEEPLSYYVTAENVTNTGTEDRTVRMRVDEFEEREDMPDEYTEIANEDWELEPGQTRDLEWEYEFETGTDGTFYFVIGSHEVRVDVGLNDEDTTASFSQLDEGADYSPAEDDEDEDRITAEFIDVPDTVIQGEVKEIAFRIENKIQAGQTVVLRIDGEDRRAVNIAAGGTLWRYKHSFTYNMQADRPPREIFIHYTGNSDLYRRRIIQIERPDADKLANVSGSTFAVSDGILELETLGRGDRVGGFEERITVYRRMNMRDNLVTQAESYLRRKYDDPEIPGAPRIHPIYSIFGEANENWLSDPDPLKGEYTITVTIDAINLGASEYPLEPEDPGYDSSRDPASPEYNPGRDPGAGLDEATVHIGGSVYGIFGTDRYRRDLFLGWLWGARYGLFAGGIVALTTIIFSTSYGMTSAYYGGWVDELMSRIQEIAMGIPTLPILIILLQFWRQSINVFVLVYALLMWRGAARVIRARGLQVAQDTYIEAAESLGSGSGRIIFKHMIPQILPYAIAQAALVVPVVIMAEAGMHILGLGDPRIVTWGTILNDARGADAVMNWQESWFWVLFPGVGMALIGFGFISTGMAIERIINPEMQHR